MNKPLEICFGGTKIVLVDFEGCVYVFLIYIHTHILKTVAKKPADGQGAPLTHHAEYM